MIDVMFYEVFEEEEREIKERLPTDIRAAFTARTVQEEGGRDLPSKLISIRTQSRIPPKWGHAMKGLLTRSQGYDHVLAFRRESGADIDCGYLENYCARAVAEQAALMMMALLRRLKKQEKNFMAFARDGLTGRECKGRRALVVGVGRIGREIVDIVRGLRMTVKGVDLVPAINDLEYVPLSEGIAWADVVFCALALTEQTEGMLDVRAFKKARQGSVFVNIARGEIAPLEGLKRLLDEGKIAGIGLDVYSQEGLLADSLRARKPANAPEGRMIMDLAGDDRVLLTPHNAFNTKEALEQKVSLTIESVVSYLRKGTFPYPVPIP